MSLPILLKNQKILLIGGGKVALQKAKVLYENNILLIEAKTNMDNKKYKVLDAQAVRLENINVNKDTMFNVEAWIEKYYKDSSLRDTLKERVGNLMMKKWKTKGKINIYGVLLADALSEYQKDKHLFVLIIFFFFFYQIYLFYLSD